MILRALIILYFAVSTVAQAESLSDLISSRQGMGMEKGAYENLLREHFKDEGTQLSLDKGLEAAVRQRDVVAVKCLLGLGANANFVSQEWEEHSLLHLALDWTSGSRDERVPDRAIQSEIINALLDAGADPSISRNYLGLTANDMLFDFHRGLSPNRAELEIIVRMLKKFPSVRGIPLVKFHPNQKFELSAEDVPKVVKALLALILEMADFAAFDWLRTLNPKLIAIEDADLVTLMMTPSTSQETIAKSIVNLNVGMSSFRLISKLKMPELYSVFLAKKRSLLFLPDKTNPLIELMEKAPQDLTNIDAMVNAAANFHIPLTSTPYCAALLKMLIESPEAFKLGIHHYLAAGWQGIISRIPDRLNRSGFLEHGIRNWMHRNQHNASAIEIKDVLERYLEVARAIDGTLPIARRETLERISVPLRSLSQRLKLEFPEDTFDLVFGKGAFVSAMKLSQSPNSVCGDSL